MIEKSENASEGIIVRIGNLYICDRLKILSDEYSVSVEWLINEAVKHLLEDVDFVRRLRNH